MRELKFRAWDKENEEYMNGYDVLLKYDGSAVSRYALVVFDTDMPVNVIIEQYTGLKDKNGREIYEGDIVETPIYGVWTTGNSDAIFGEKMWKLAVFWADADCGFLFKVIGSKNQPNRAYDVLDQHLGALEVIGNIHEDPELLEEDA